MTKDLLIIEKISMIKKDMIVMVSGGSRNICLLKLRNGGDFEVAKDGETSASTAETKVSPKETDVDSEEKEKKATIPKITTK